MTVPEEEGLEAVDRTGLVAALTLITGDPLLAEDAVQEALLRAWQKADAGDPVDSWPAWVVTVALNRTRNHFRSLGRERAALTRLAAEVPTTAGPSPTDPADRAAASVDLLRAMTSLTRRQREVVTLYYRLDLPLAKIAAALSVSEGTVKTLLHRARARLRPLLEERNP
jgi:RNA polymerase sigma-70 factor (ECF subfamily)